MPTGAKASAILGFGGYRPRRVVDNAEICTLIDSSDEWIRTRSGIIERRWASPDETIQMMSVAASRKALERSGVEPGQIDTVIVSTVTHLHQTPAIATSIAAELGATGAAAFDISAACAGFCYATAMADSFIRSGASKYVLIIGVERLSDMTDKHDRSTAFLFADGAGAAVVGPSQTPGIGPVVWGSDGDQVGLIGQTQAWDNALQVESRGGVADAADGGQPGLQVGVVHHGQDCRRGLDAAGVRPEDLDVFAPHQANMRITDAMFRALKLPADVVVARDIAYQGNTSAASIPLAVEALLESGEAKSGDTCLIIGFGAGLVYAGQVIVLP